MKLPDIVRRVVLPHPPARVWAALTDAEALGAWLMPNDFRPVVGHRFTFRTDPAPGFDGIVHAEVLRLEPERTLSFSWRGGGVDTVVRFDLEPHPTGTRLTLVHGGFGARGVLPRVILGFGWRRRVLPALAHHLHRSLLSPQEAPS